MNELEAVLIQPNTVGQQDQMTEATRGWSVENQKSYRLARAFVHYSDSVLYSVTEPREGGRDEVAKLLLGSAAKALIESVDPTFVGDCSVHAFWRQLDLSGPHSDKMRELLSQSPAQISTRQALQEARSVIWSGIQKLEEPEVARNRKSILKVAKIVLGLLVIGSAGLGMVKMVQQFTKTPDLLAGKPFRLSSELGRSPGSSASKLLFHTGEDASPWVEYDFGTPTTIKEITIQNRSDCCDENAIPLVVEVGNNQSDWRVVASRKNMFSRVTLTFEPVETRYVRVRTMRPSHLHLEAVEAR
jgi:F5/8 type C domain